MTLLTRRRSAFCALLTSAALLGAGTDAHAQASRAGSTGSGARTGSGATGANRGGTTTTRSNSSSTGSSGTSQYRPNTQLGNATIQIDPETRSLVIVTDADTELELEKVIKNLDQPKPQVLIKVAFVEVTYNNSSDIGLEANYTFNVGKTASPASTVTTNTVNTQNGTNASGGTNNTTTTTNSTATNAAVLANGIGSVFGLSSVTQGTFVRVLTDDWGATLQALETKGKVEVLSRPSIMARNNQEAVIIVGSEVPFVTSSLVSDTGQVTNNITYDNVGIILRVTPFITSEGSIEMIVSPEISALTDQTVPISSNASAPVISKRSAETVVVTPNAKTVVIGGLMQTQRLSSVQKVPLLGDIPYLGYAFRRTIKSDVKSELMVFLTPYIVNNKGEYVELTGRELAKTEIMKNSFTDKDLHKYLDMDGAQDPLPNIDNKEVRPAIPMTQTRTTTTRRTVRTEAAPATRGNRVKETTTTTKSVTIPRRQQSYPPKVDLNPDNLMSPPSPNAPIEAPSSMVVPMRRQSSPVAQPPGTSVGPDNILSPPSPNAPITTPDSSQ